MRHPNKKWDNPTRVFADGVRSNLPEYQQWCNMRHRCKVNGDYQTSSPSYVGCTYDTDWRSYDVWLEWARQQIGFLNRDELGMLWQCDKDLLLKGNKHYSPETCVFVPREINSLLILRKAGRGDLPLGVSPDNLKGVTPKYKAQACYGESKRYLGCFATPDLAFQAYKYAKERHARSLAVKYAGLVDVRVTQMLNNYIVDIGD